MNKKNVYTDHEEYYICTIVHRRKNGRSWRGGKVSTWTEFVDKLGHFRKLRMMAIQPSTFKI